MFRDARVVLARFMWNVYVLNRGAATSDTAESVPGDIRSDQRLYHSCTQREPSDLDKAGLNLQSFDPVSLGPCNLDGSQRQRR